MNPLVRFAPSPTGKLHIGGVRTALFNYLYAKNNNGTFLLRIEDTDRQRSEDKYTDQILESLHWLGLDYDGVPIKQSSRNDRYQEVIKDLLKNQFKVQVTTARMSFSYKRTYSSPPSLMSVPAYLL